MQFRVTSAERVCFATTLSVYDLEIRFSEDQERDVSGAHVDVSGKLSPATSVLFLPLNF